MFNEEQLKIAETFLGTAVNSGILDAAICQEMVNRIKRQEEVLLPYAAVEKRLGISRMTVYRMVGKGELEGVKVRGSARVTKSSLERLIMGAIENKNTG
jgi:excisionase family DNA binding protein